MLSAVPADAQPFSQGEKRGYVHGGKCFIFLEYNVQCQYSQNKERI